VADRAPDSITAERVAPLVPKRDPDGHKGTFGTVVCVCGSLDYAGAALLSGTAAARAGAGLAGLAVPASLQRLFTGRVPELITIGLPDNDEGTDIDAMGAGHALKPRAPEAIVFGSGIRESDGSLELLLGLLKREGASLVVDGGGLNLLSRAGEWWKSVKRPLVLTPHPGEFGRLTGSAVGADDDERASRVRDAAEQFHCVIVLKGARTVVAAPDGQLARSEVATALLSTAGSGDVLAGTIGSYIAQGVEPYDAAVIGVYLHARAGELAGQRLGDSGLLASELTSLLPVARRELVERLGQKSVGFRRG
jgi:NAD(P)H-hydrate epimerase